MCADLLDPDLALAFLEKRAFGPRTKALGGALLGLGLHQLVAGPAIQRLSDLAESGTPAEEGSEAALIEEDTKGEAVGRWVRKFKEEHPATKDVPVYISGKVPGSLYIRDIAFRRPSVAQAIEEKFGIKEPGVYLREISAPIALHEMGHAEIEKKIPNVSLLTHGTSLLSLPLLGWTIFRRPGGAPKFIAKYSPAIAAALQVPFLAEEAAASIMAEKTLRSEGETGASTLLPAFLSHAVDKAKWPLAAAAALLMKR